jgi:hypothetical protein
MAIDLPSLSGGVPAGATMQTQYMGRIMTTYPISEPELENIATLDTQVTIRFTVAGSLLSLAMGIWTNAIFAKELTAAGQLASEFVAPLLLVFALGYAIAGFMSRRNRRSAWQRIKGEAQPIRTLAEAGGLMISGSHPPAPKRGGRS